MSWDSILVGLILIGALLFLIKTFRPKKNGDSGCGCGTVDCKVPKPEIKKAASPKPTEQEPK